MSDLIRKPLKEKNVCVEFPESISTAESRITQFSYLPLKASFLSTRFSHGNNYSAHICMPILGYISLLAGNTSRTKLASFSYDIYKGSYYFFFSPVFVRKIFKSPAGKYDQRAKLITDPWWHTTRWVLLYFWLQMNVLGIPLGKKSSFRQVDPPVIWTILSVNVNIANGKTFLITGGK